MKLLILCIIILTIRSDIPTHCFRSQVSGKWTFQLTAPQVKNISGLYSHTCGHKLPSNEVTSYNASIDDSLFTKSISIDLRSNNEAYMDNKVSCLI
jgi:hypothetical protein